MEAKVKAWLSVGVPHCHPMGRLLVSEITMAKVDRCPTRTDAFSFVTYLLYWPIECALAVIAGNPWPAKQHVWMASIAEMEKWGKQHKLMQ